MTAARGGSRRPVDWIGWAVATGAGTIVAVCAIAPLVGAGARIVAGALSSPALPDGAPGLARGSLGLLMSGVAWSALIAVLCAPLALAGAWSLWRGGRVCRAALLAPLLVPSTLAFAGWGLLRAPDTWLGAALERAAQRGWHELPVIVGKTLAATGLALWVFPLGAIAVWSGLRATDPAVLDAMRVDGASRRRTGIEFARLCRADLVLGSLLVALLMLGSAVPLHLAQVETLAIQVWFALDNLARDQQWRAWAAAWPLLLIAVAAGWGLGGRARSFDPGEVRSSPGAPRVIDALPGALPWSLGVLVPLILFLSNLGRAGSLARFWENNGGAIARSAAVGAWVALGTLLISIGTAWAVSRRGVAARLGGLGLRALMISGLVPGVLIGSAISALVTRLDSPALDNSLAPVVAAHLARLGFLGALAGCWSANAARRVTDDLARMDGADAGPGWWRACLRPMLFVHLAAAGSAGILSLHEIEAAVMVMPPGDCLARVILGDLHYSRVADMSAAGVWLLTLGLAPVVLAGVWQTWRRFAAMRNGTG